MSFSFDGSFVAGGISAEDTVSTGLPPPIREGAVGGASTEEGTGIKVFGVESGEEVCD